MTNPSALVVDDSKSARFALRKYLEGYSYQVEAVESAEEAIRFLRDHRPEVIFLDHIMPGTDGFEALRAIKSDPQTVHIPVVICSSNEGVEFNAQARSRGASGVLQKPPSPQQLAEVLAGLRQLASALQAEAPPAAEPAAPVPSKVTNIREPDVAIEQVVMMALRKAMPPAVEASEAAIPPALPAAAEPAEPAPAMPEPMLPSAAATPAPPAAETPLRDLYESRMRRITQDLYLQLGELRASVALIEAGQRSPEEDRRIVQEVAADALDGTGERLHALESRLGLLERDVEQQLAELRAQIDAALELQAARIEQIREAACMAAADEAHAVAERTVMSAASRISDRLAESILKALGRS